MPVISRPARTDQVGGAGPDWHRTGTRRQGSASPGRTMTNATVVGSPGTSFNQTDRPPRQDGKQCCFGINAHIDALVDSLRDSDSAGHGGQLHMRSSPTVRWTGRPTWSLPMRLTQMPTSGLTTLAKQRGLLRLAQASAKFLRPPNWWAIAPDSPRGARPECGQQ